MKRIISSGLLILSVVACSDDQATSPTRQSIEPITPESGELADRAMTDGVGAASVNLFAVVGTNGNLISGSNVLSSTIVGPGQYEVTFNRDVSQCAFLVNTSNAYSQAIQAYAAGGHASSQGVFIETKNQGGGLTSGPFHLWVNCGGSNAPFAVIDYSGQLARGSAGTTVSGWSGTYSVRFARPVSHCAFLASVSDPSNGLVLSPSGVYTASSSDSQTVYIETKNPGGGLQPGVPFHLAALCPGEPATKFMVVRGDGARIRWAPNQMTSQKISAGNYRITSGVSIAACAKIVTRGSIDTAVPYYPATVEITAGTNTKNYGVQVRDLLFFGGNLVSRQFHTGMIC